jgi:hypothetical protein
MAIDFTAARSCAMVRAGGDGAFQEDSGIVGFAVG